MKILRLDLFAFGPFTNGKLDFSKKPGALQLVYGPNEAGKSTTLRALLSLLYGIPLRTSDAHLHEMARLRIGATLSDHQGRTLKVVRRKGQKHTLLDESGQPLPDALLSELMLGIDEPMYRNMFGLDHVRLREGAEALLSGGGNAGEGLFDASVGTRALRDLKESLRLEAEELYKARGKTPRLNAALDSLREMLRKKKEAALSPSTFSEQEKALSAAQRRREQLLVERRELAAEKSRLSRDLSLLPLLARHDVVLSELRALVFDPAESADAPRSPKHAPSEGFVRELERRFGMLLSAQAELPQLSAELTALERGITALRERLGSALQVVRAVDTPLRTRLRRLSDAQQAAERRAAELAQAALSTREALAALAHSAERSTTSPHADALASLVANLQREDLGAKRARIEVELSKKLGGVERGLAQLGLEGVAQDALGASEWLAKLRLPEESELSFAERKELSLERALGRFREQTAKLEEQLRALDARKAALLSGGALSSLADLSSARAARDACFLQLEQEFSRANVIAYQHALERADALSDKLRGEAARSAEMTQVELELARLTREHSAERARAEQLEAERAEHRAHVRALFADTQLVADDVRSLHPKRLKLVALSALASEALALHAEQRTLVQRERALLADLRRCLPADEPPAATLELALSTAQAELTKLAAAAQEQKNVEQRRAELELLLRKTERELAQLDEQRAAGSVALARELGFAGLAPDLRHDEALACLDDLAALHDALRQKEQLKARIENHSLQSEQLAQEVAREVEKLEPEAAALALPEQLTLLSRVERAARETERDRGRLREERARLESELASLGDGASLEALRTRLSGLDPHALRARLLEIEGQTAQLDDAIGALDQEIGGLSSGLERLREGAYATPVAEDVEAELAHVRGLVRRYLEVRLSLSLLGREVERHRREHQGPLVTRASALFSELTLGRYSGLSVELDEHDEPLLCAVAAKGAVVRVAGLSDGTRDQLYLALRVASIERFLDRSPALPLVLDDAFIHFDDARAEAALGVLGALSKKTQVLFFTHHARMVELAKRALKPAQLALHELDPVKGTVAFRDNGPLFAGA